MIDLDALTSTEQLSLGKRGPVEVRTLDGAGEHALRDALVRPGRVDATAFAVEILARCSDLSLADVRALSHGHRGRLTAAVVRVNDWQRDWVVLYGSHLSADERLLAVASWGYKRSHAAALIRLRKIRRQHLQGVERRAEALGAAGLAQVSDAAAKAQRFVAGQREVTRAAGALANFHKLMGYGGATRGLLAATRPNPLLGAVDRPPWALGTVKAPPSFFTPPSSLAVAARGASGFSDAVLGLNRIRASVATVTTGLTLPRTMYGRVDVPRFDVVRGTTLPRALTDALTGTRTAWGFSDSLAWITSGALGENFAARLSRGAWPFSLGETFRAWEGVAETWAAIDQFLAAWEDEALWYLFSALSTGASAKLGRLTRGEVETVVFDALEQVFADPELLEAVIAQLDLVPDLAGPHRDQMRQALVFVRTGDYHLAQPLLHVAFESMLYQGALRLGLVQPVKGKISAAESLLKLLFSSGDLFLNFTLRMVFGGVGNSYRHGRNPDGHRELMLAGMVALAGYMDWTTGTHAIEIVARRLERQLDPAIERLETHRQSALVAGS